MNPSVGPHMYEVDQCLVVSALVKYSTNKFQPSISVIHFTSRKFVIGRYLNAGCCLK